MSIHNQDEIEIKRAEVSDIEGIIELIRSCYGEMCSDTHMYQREYMQEQLENGKMTIYLAYKEKEKILGMEACCAKEEFPQTAYLKNKMTLKEYRGLGIGARITEKLMEEYDFSVWNSAFALGLAYSSVSQGILTKYGFHMTGFQYNGLLKSQELEVTNERTPKRSHVVMVRNVQVKDVGLLYLPTELVAVAGTIYRSLGVSYQMKNDGLCSHLISELRIYRDEFHQDTQIVVERTGKNLMVCMEGIRAKEEQNPLQTYNLFLNIKDEGAIWAYRELREAGFVASGLKPLGQNQEYLILYYSSKVPVYPEGMCVHEKFNGLKNQFFELLNEK